MIVAPLLYQRILSLTIAWLIATSFSPVQAASENLPKIVRAQIGFQGIYKLGCWTPVEVEILGGSQSCTGRVVVTVPDTDGVPTRIVSEPTRPAGIDAGQTTVVRMFARIGQTLSPVEIKFVSDDAKLSVQRTFSAAPEDHPGTVRGGVPATNRVLLEFGNSLGLGELLRNQQRPDQQLTTRIAHIESAEELPTRWYGYESIDKLLLSTSDSKLYRPLLQNQARLEALEDWIQRGGSLVIFCAAEAEELLGENGVLARFAPGKLEKMEQLTQAQPLATFSGSEQPITRDRRINLSVPSLVEVQGQILASAGRTRTNVPLVVRTRRGLGEIVFVALDFDTPPLRDWEGRTSFLRRALDWDTRDKNKQTELLTDVEDLSAHLRNSLDRKFVGVEVVPFGLVALLAGIYILLIGPGDYFFVKRILRRTELTWLTFPLIVIGISAAAYAIANHWKGNQLRVNQVEIVDVDCTTAEDNNQLARGTVWTHFFTPRVSQWDLTLQPRYLGQTDLSNNERLVSWLGLPGYALGGMQASGSQTAVLDAGYQYGPQLASLEQLPVQVWSTKTLTGRWSAQVDATVAAALRQTGDELIVGQVRNNSEVELEECVLLYGRWAYNLGRLPAGRSADINDALRPRTVKTMLTNATAGDETVNKTSEDGTVPFHRAEWDLARLIKVMMFYQSINGLSYTGKHFRYQSFVDMSDLLDYDDVAILLTRCAAPGSPWQADSEPLASDKDRNWTYYRFLFPVERPDTTN